MPDIAPPEMKELARRLLARETPSRKRSEAGETTAFPVCEKFRRPLSSFTGVAGFRSLLSRALALAGEEVHWLRALHIKADGSLEGLDELEAELDAREVAEGEVVLVGHLLELLVTFIGSTFTLQLLRDIWPNKNGLNF